MGESAVTALRRGLREQTPCPALSLAAENDGCAGAGDKSSTA